MIEKEQYELPLIASKLLDLENHSDITIEDVIATFQEDYIIENLVSSEVKLQNKGSLFEGFRGVLNENNLTGDDESNNPFHPNSHTNSIMESQREEKQQSQAHEFFKLDNFTLQDNQSEHRDLMAPQELDFISHLKQ